MTKAKAAPPSRKPIDLLLRKFKEGQLKNPRWSQRAYAQKLGLSSGALSEILKGRRPVSTPLKKKIAQALQLSPSEQMEFFDEEIPASLRPVRHDYFRLSTDQFHLISDWWHFAILNLLKTKGFKGEQSWIANRLGLSTKVVTDAWDRLIRLGHLKRVNGKIVREHARIESTDNFFDLSVRKSHIEDAKLIEKSVLENSIELRDHTSMTFAFSRKNMPRAKEMIRSFQDQFMEELAADAESSPGDEVYKMSVSLFPLTKIKENS